MDERQRSQAESYGHGAVKKVLHTATILHEGWEMDNKAWIVEMEDGTTAAFTTNHGGVCPWQWDDALECLRKTNASGNSIRNALGMWPNRK